MKLAKTARNAVPSEEVLAAGIFLSGGSLTERMSGWGEFSVRRREREERESSGLAFKRHMLLVVTPTRLHVFDARSAGWGWKAKRKLAVWDRSAIRAAADPKSVTIRLTLEIPSENRRLSLEAPKARRATSGEVARTLASSSSRPEASYDVPTRGLLSSAELEEAARGRKLHNRVGWLAVTGGLTRLGAYSMPWIVLSRPGGAYPVQMSGYRALGSPVLSLVYSIVIVVAGGLYLAGRRESSPRLFQTMGISSIVVFFIQYSIVLHTLDQVRAALVQGGIAASVSTGFGVWAELAGAILTTAAGIWAVKLRKRLLPPRRPDLRPTTRAFAA